MIDEALEKLGVGPAIFVVHSWAGALGARMALDCPQRVAGLMMLAPVAYPWRGGVGWYNKLVTTPVIGPLLACTITLPLGYFLTEPGARKVFLPQIMPNNFVEKTATRLLLRPREFLANARDLVTLKAAVAEQAPRYGNIRVPVVVITGDTDKTVSPTIHSRPFAAALPDAKLIVLPDVGHIVQNAAPELVAREIGAMIGKIAHGTAVPGMPEFLLRVRIAIIRAARRLPGFTDLGYLSGKVGIAGLPMPWRSTQSGPDVLDSSSQIDQSGCAFA